jgi:hypothetical protein
MMTKVCCRINPFGIPALQSIISFVFVLADNFSHGDRPEPSEKPSSVPDFSGVPVKTEYWTDDSDSEDFHSTVSATVMPALEQPNLVVPYPYYYEDPADMGTFNSFNNFNNFNTQYTEQFSFKTSPNARRVSEDSRADAEDADDSDMKPSAVVPSSYVGHPYTNYEFNLQPADDSDMKPSSYVGHPYTNYEVKRQPNQHAPALPAGFDFESNQQGGEMSGFGDSFAHAAASASVLAPYHNADTFVDSLLNEDFSGQDFSSHDFSGHYFPRNPFVKEDDEANNGNSNNENEQEEEVVEI